MHMGITPARAVRYNIIMGFYTINGGTSESATEIRGAPGITRDVGFTAYSYKVQILILY